jgi:hypothetical protein
MPDLTTEIANNEAFQEFWKTKLERAFVGVSPLLMGDFKECAYRAFVAGYAKGQEDAKDDEAMRLEAESDY